MNYVFHFQSIWNNTGLFLSGTLVTLQLAVLAMLFGTVLGILGAVARNSHWRIARGFSAAAVEVIRNTPLLVQLYLWYFGLGVLGVDVPPYWSVVIALGVNNGGYLTEIIRAGIEAIKIQQIKAGVSLGMSGFQVFRYIIIMPALGIVFPAVSNQFVISILMSALAMIIGVKDLTYQAVYLQAHTFRSIETYIVVIVLYIILSKAIVLFSEFLDRRLFKYKYI
ncbi:MAG: amino acid ABC transporter permease [Desulfobacteraceae bacterium]|jgi:polar amino acid transport system permease protein|nr:amino acid ABC transporter permease [Desulfobacteraceae bacterium]